MNWEHQMATHVLTEYRRRQQRRIGVAIGGAGAAMLCITGISWFSSWTSDTPALSAQQFVAEQIAGVHGPAPFSPDYAWIE